MAARTNIASLRNSKLWAKFKQHVYAAECSEFLFVSKEIFADVAVKRECRLDRMSAARKRRVSSDNGMETTISITRHIEDNKIVRAEPINQSGWET